VTNAQGQIPFAADRAWRSPDARLKFELDTGLTDRMTEEYQTRFVQWANGPMATDESYHPEWPLSPQHHTVLKDMRMAGEKRRQREQEQAKQVG
jgi:hypothetical protein